MTHYTLMFVILFSLALTAGGKPDSEEVTVEAEFLAGIALLQADTALAPSLKARKYRQLQEMTGISPAQAKKILKRYRKHPREWVPIHKSMEQLLTSSTADGDEE